MSHDDWYRPNRKFQQFTLVRWHRLIKFTIHDVTITFKLTDKSLHFPTPLPGPTVGPCTRSFIDRSPNLVSLQDLRWSYPFDLQTLLSLPLLPTFLPHTAFFPGHSEWLRDSCKLLPPQGFPARVGVAPGKITNKNKCIFSHGPTILIFPLHDQSFLQCSLRSLGRDNYTFYLWPDTIYANQDLTNCHVKA